MSIIDVIASIACAIAVSSFLSSISVFRLARRTEAREGTAVLVQEWWSNRFREIRTFYQDQVAPSLFQQRTDEDDSFRKFEDSIGDRVDGKFRDLCLFFDRVGWL